MSRERERIPTDEPLNVTVARIETKQDTIIANQSVMQSTMECHGKELASRPCRQHAKRISALVKSVDALRVNGVRANTRTEAVWTTIKIMGAALVGLGGIVFGVLQALK